MVNLSISACLSSALLCVDGGGERTAEAETERREERRENGVTLNDKKHNSDAKLQCLHLPTLVF